MRASAASLASEYSPRQAGVIRPSGVTAVISTITIPAPDKDSEPKCCRCQSFAEPSTALYWHIGDTVMRLGRIRPPMVIGENKGDGIRNSTTDLRRPGLSGETLTSSARKEITGPRRKIDNEVATFAVLLVDFQTLLKRSSMTEPRSRPVHAI
jgi:hypothetical protein